MATATEHTPQPVYPHPLLTLYCPQFILMLSSHQHSPFRYFSWTFPDIVTLQIVKQTSELYLFNQRKEKRIYLTSVNRHGFV